MADFDAPATEAILYVKDGFGEGAGRIVRDRVGVVIGVDLGVAEGLGGVVGAGVLVGEGVGFGVGVGLGVGVETAKLIWTSGGVC